MFLTNNSPLTLVIFNAIGVLIYMSIVFGVAYKRKRLDTVDAAWGGGFVVASWLVAGLEPSFRTVLIALLIDVWAVRLTSHILDRSSKRSDDDPRYTELAKKWGPKNYWQRAYVSIFLLQGFMVVLISLPTVFAAGDSNDYATLLTIVGLIVWVKGFAIEALGDYQLKQFLADKSNKGKVLKKGLWRYTRHPNYLGEITQWYGIGIIACSASYGWVGLVGPVILNLLIRYVSGVPPIENRKKKDPAYAEYMRYTNAILPRFSKTKK